MHAKWSEVINERTSSQQVHDSVVALLSKVTEYDDASDFRGIKSGIARDLADWAARKVRVDGKVSDDVFTDSPFVGISGILELMPVAQKNKTSSPSDYISPLIVDDEEVVQTFADGVTISRIVTREAEIILIEKSLGTFAYERDGFRRRPSDDPKSFWLVNSYEGQKLAIFETSEDTVNGMRLLGRTGLSPYGHVLEFARARNLSLLSPATLPGVVMAHDGTVHPVLRMPDGITIDGDLEIFSRYRMLDFLPDNMTVRGRLTINDCKRLRHLPSGLTVRGDLSVHGCDQLRTIGKNLRVEGDASFIFCRSLKILHEGCEFGGDLHLDNRKLLRRDFRLGGDAWIGVGKDARRVAYPPGIIARFLRAA